MIGPTKRKLTRKEMKKDPLIDNYFKVREFISIYQKQLLYGLGGLLVIVIVIILLINRSADREEKASTEFGKILSIYNSGAYKQAIDGIPQKNIKGLKFIVSEYGSTETGENSKIFLANCYLNLEQFDEALKYFDDYSGGNKLLKAAAYAGVATCYEAKQDLEKAAEYYVKAANVQKDENNSPAYLLNAAKLYAQLNKNEKSKKLFDQIKSEYPTSQIAREPERYKADLSL